jgi:hypothetical protein
MQPLQGDGRTPPTRPEVRVSPTRPEARVPSRVKAPQVRPRRLLRLLGPLVGLTALVTLAQTPPGHSLLRLTGLVQSPAAYSALYFIDPGGLPATLPSGHVALNVSFAVHNASQSPNSYRWTVQVVQGRKTHPAASGTVTIPAAGTKAENRSVTAFCPSGVLEVVVRLATPAESIHFRAVCRG